MAKPFAPQNGEPVTIKAIRKGAAVRYPLTLKKLAAGDVVIWSTFFSRRMAEGALEVAPYKPEPQARKNSPATSPEDEPAKES